MGNGFKRFIDFSPLSVKSLNDQLEQLWLKVMGGIGYRDLDKNAQNIIQSKMDEDEVMSIIEQSSNELILAVGKGGGDNLVKNGNWNFGLDSWLYLAATIESGCVRVNNGYVLQQSIRIEEGKKYTIGFEGYGNVDVYVGIFGQYSGQSSDTGGVQMLFRTLEPSRTWKQYKADFAVPAGVVSCYIKLQAKGEFRFRKIYLREGEGVSSYTSNPNEIDGSGVSISEDAVHISASSFNLDIKDSNGNVTSVLSTDGSGFDNLLCSNMTIAERNFYGDGTVNIYINSSSGKDSNSGLSTYAPFKTIARALKAVPLHIKGSYILHFSGGIYHEDIDLNYGGSGRLSILGESATLYGHIYMCGSGYNLLIRGLNIYTRDSYCIKGIGPSCYLTLTSCVLDSNNAQSSYGVNISDAFRMYMNLCEINNCQIAINCTKGSFLDLVDCKGKGNEAAVIANDMAVINASGTVPVGNVISKETNGGRIDGYIIGGIVGTNYQQPRDAIKTAVFNASAKFTYTGSKMINGRIIQGKGSGGFLAFNTASVKTTLSGKVIKSVKVTVKRRGDDQLAYDGVLRAFVHNVASSAGAFSYVEEYGDVCTVKRGETVNIELPLTIISKMIAGTAKGILFYDNTGEKNHYFELDSTFASRLEVLYV